MADLEVLDLGQQGVNVDKDPLELGDGELQQAQNAVSDATAGLSALRKRPGLVAFTTGAVAGTVLGGIGVPLQNQTTGIVFFFIGRGTTS